MGKVRVNTQLESGCGHGGAQRGVDSVADGSTMGVHEGVCCVPRMCVRVNRRRVRGLCCSAMGSAVEHHTVCIRIRRGSSEDSQVVARSIDPPKVQARGIPR